MLKLESTMVSTSYARGGRDNRKDPFCAETHSDVISSLEWTLNPLARTQGQQITVARGHEANNTLKD